MIKWFKNFCEIRSKNCKWFRCTLKFPKISFQLNFNPLSNKFDIIRIKLDYFYYTIISNVYGFQPLTEKRYLIFIINVPC